MISLRSRMGRPVGNPIVFGIMDQMSLSLVVSMDSKLWDRISPIGVLAQLRNHLRHKYHPPYLFGNSIPSLPW